MNLGILLLHCNDTDEQRRLSSRAFTRFTREWAESAIGRVASYFFKQSGGRETISFKVYDWVPISVSEAEWSNLGFGAFDSLRKEIQDFIGGNLDSFTNILIAIDHSQASGGTTFGASAHTVTYLAASNFTPFFISHELGHSYGAPDAFRETDTGENIYENRFCVMGALGWPAVFADDAIPDPTRQMLNLSGPGMSVPTLMATGWLKEDAHGACVELSDNNLFSGGGVVQQLSALSGAPGPTGMQFPIMIRYHDIVIEYRIGASSGWDRGLPDPGAGAGGWVVVHRSSRNAPRALFVNSIAARPGATLLLAKDNPLDLFNPGPVKISVLSFNPGNRTVNLSLTRRAARLLPGGIPFGGVEVGGGGLVWTPGRGFTPVPPRSPLFRVLEEVAKLQALQEMMTVASREELDGLTRESAGAMDSLMQSVSGVQNEPLLSPLAHALKNVSLLLNDSQELESSSSTEPGKVQQFINESRQQLADVKQILSRAVEDERRR